MAIAKLQVVGAGGEVAGARVRRLMDEARDAAREQVVELEAVLARAVRLAGEVAKGGDVYPAGVRDLAERVALEVDARARQIAAVTRGPTGRPH